jgi:hypothetical protein
MCADQWSDLVKQSYLQLLHFFKNSAIPSVMEHYGFDKESEILEILRWQYPDKAGEGDASSLLGKLLEVSRAGTSLPLRQPSFSLTAIWLQSDVL